MAFVLDDRVKETSTSTGTGTLSLAGAESGFQGFVAGIGDTNSTFICIQHTSADEWEVCETVVADGAPDTVTRGTLIASSTGSRVNFSAGTKNVFCTLPGKKVGLKEWTQIATATPSGTGAVTFSSIPSTYTDLKIKFEGLSLASSVPFALYISNDNGSTWSATPLSLGDYPSSAVINGALYVASYNDDVGITFGGLSEDVTTNLDFDNPDRDSAWKATGGIDAIKIQTTSGNFDAGTITLYGR